MCCSSCRIQFNPSMLVCLHRALLHHHHHQPPFSFLTLRSISATSNHHSFTVSYLINSCGLSPESALYASKFVNFQNSKRPDAVIDLLKNHGFSQPQISTIIEKIPSLLLANPEKSLLPKFDYLRSLGFSNAELAKVIAIHPRICRRNLEKQLIPNFAALRDFLESDRKAIACIKNSAVVFDNFTTAVFPNIKILRDTGVPESKIKLMVRHHARAMTASCHTMKEVVEKTKKMGFDPLDAKFLTAVKVHIFMSESTLERKFQVYHRWGWSREDFMVAFRKHPLCVLISDEKLMAKMEFLVEKMGSEPLYFVDKRWLLSWSLEKRIVPRCLVVKDLLSKGLAETNFSLSTILRLTDKDFLDKFVMPHLGTAPELLDIYPGRHPVQ